VEFVKLIKLHQFVVARQAVKYQVSSV